MRHRDLNAGGSVSLIVEMFSLDILKSELKYLTNPTNFLMDTENFLDDCIVLNTYSDYFISNTGFECIQITCGMKCYDSCLKMSLNCKRDIVDKQVQFIGPLAIDELVKINSSAEKELKDRLSPNGFYPYNFTFKNLRQNLEKFI